jgi:hypothetical protein
MRPNAILLLATSLGLAGVPARLGGQTPRNYSYDFRLDPGDKKSERVIHGTVRVSGARARVETDEEKPHGERSYFLIGNEGRTVYVVHPDRQTYEAHDVDEFAQVVGTAMRAAGPVMKISVRDVQLDTARLGAGDKVAGRQTQRVQLRQRWTTSMRVLGFVKEDMRGTSVAEYWTDPSMPLMRNPLFELVSTAHMALASADADFMAQANGARAVLFRGSPLKADIRLRMNGEDGDDETHLRYEVTKITMGGVDDSALAVPKGYRRTNSREVSF